MWLFASTAGILQFTWSRYVPTCTAADHWGGWRSRLQNLSCACCFEGCMFLHLCFFVILLLVCFLDGAWSDERGWFSCRMDCSRTAPMSKEIGGVVAWAAQLGRLSFGGTRQTPRLICKHHSYHPGTRTAQIGILFLIKYQKNGVIYKQFLRS